VVLGAPSPPVISSRRFMARASLVWCTVGLLQKRLYQGQVGLAIWLTLPVKDHCR
jgi:hypothetical protein